MSWLNNPWLVGIGTGILSGLLVTWLLNLFLSKKKDREYQQRISSANREIIYSIRGGIPENNLPRREVIEALINSTARRYGVEPSELFQPKEISEELIKEVMDSSFLSTERKVEYCSALVPLGENPPILLLSEEAAIPISIEERRKELQTARIRISRLEWLTNITFGVIAALISALASIRGDIPSLNAQFEFIKNHLAISVVIVVLALYGISVLLKDHIELNRLKELERGVSSEKWPSE